MAIQKINLGTEPLGEGGDTYRSANTKINENFSNTAHAASRLVGTSSGQIPLSSQVGEAYGLTLQAFEKNGDVNEAPAGEIAHYAYTSANLPTNMACVVYTQTQHANAKAGRKYQVAVEYAGRNIYYRTEGPSGWQGWEKHYSTANIKKDSNSNLLLEHGTTIPSTSAASRLVGLDPTNLVQVQDAKTATLIWRHQGNISDPEYFDNAEGGAINYIMTAVNPSPDSKLPEGITATWLGGSNVVTEELVPNTGRLKQTITRTAGLHKGVHEIFRMRNGTGGKWTDWVHAWTTANATKDSNGFLKGASPIVNLYDNKIELNGDASNQGIEFIKNGKGDYTLKTKTGLRSDNTWQIEVPQDNNKNPLLAVNIDAQEDGTINIKCFKRIFSMETFLFGPDINEPMDITEGRFISVRLNDNPEPEQPDEPEPVVEEPIVGEVVEPEVVEESTEEPSEEAK